MTTSATKGKAARDVAHGLPHGCCGGVVVDDRTLPHNELCEVALRAIEADRSQLAAIHEEELREARELLRAVTVSCPNCDEDRRVECSDECVAIAPNIDKARAYLARVGASQQTGTPPAPVPTVCAEWCGTDEKTSRIGYWRAGKYYCTPACRDAGRPLHPATPGEPGKVGP